MSVTDFADRLCRLRRDLHRAPELAFDERETAGRISRALDVLGVAHRCGVGGHGVVADLGPDAGPRVALRSDMDALPIDEETGLPFASERPGVMHACGHDGHMAVLIGAAELLLGGEPLPVPVRLIFQPAEEIAEGARAMIDDGALDGVEMIFGGHIDRRYETGTLIVSEGTVNASTDKLEIDVVGRSGHGARPHETTDAVVVASALVTALQTVVSREVDPADPAVVTIGSLEAGTAHNVIAGRAHLTGTVRAHSVSVREQLERSIRRICSGIGALHGATIDVTIRSGPPPVVNTPEMTALAREAAAAVVGAQGVVPLRSANMGGEDFAFFLAHARGAFIRYGAQIAGAEGFPAHSSRFDFDEAALPIAARYLERVARLAAARIAT